MKQVEITPDKLGISHLWHGTIIFVKHMLIRSVKVHFRAITTKMLLATADIARQQEILKASIKQQLILHFHEFLVITFVVL